MSTTLAQPRRQANYLAMEPEHQIDVARAWLAADHDTVTQLHRVTVLAPIGSARIPRNDIAVPE